MMKGHADRSIMRIDDMTDGGLPVFSPQSSAFRDGRGCLCHLKTDDCGLTTVDWGVSDAQYGAWVRRTVIAQNQLHLVFELQLALLDIDFFEMIGV